MNHLPEPKYPTREIVNADVYFEVSATAHRVVTLDIAGLSPDEIADRIYSQAAGISLCHECSHEVSGAELGDISVMEISGRTYSRNPNVPGGWEVTP